MGMKEREKGRDQQKREKQRERERVMHRLLTHKHVQRSKHHTILHNTQTSSYRNSFNTLTPNSSHIDT